MSDAVQPWNVLSLGNQYQVRERIHTEPLLQGICGFKVPPGQPNHYISVFYTSSYQPFLKGKEEMMFSQCGPFLSDTSPFLDSFQNSLFSEPFFVCWVEKGKRFSKNLTVTLHITKISKMIPFCNLHAPPLTHTHQILNQFVILLLFTNI